MVYRGKVGDLGECGRERQRAWVLHRRDPCVLYVCVCCRLGLQPCRHCPYERGVPQCLDADVAVPAEVAATTSHARCWLQALAPPVCVHVYIWICTAVGEQLLV